MKKTNFIVGGFCLLIGALAGAQSAPTCNISGEKPFKIYREYPDEFPVGSLEDFGVVVNDGIYRGSRPKRPSDFEFLKKLGVKTIVDLEIADFNQDPEEEKAAAYGMKVEVTALEASPVQPSESSVNRALRVMNDKSKWPVYVHCNFGKHRTGMVVALYRNLYEGCSKEASLKEMSDFGFIGRYIPAAGLHLYLDDHLK